MSNTAGYRGSVIGSNAPTIPHRHKSIHSLQTDAHETRQSHFKVFQFLHEHGQAKHPSIATTNVCAGCAMTKSEFLTV